MTNKIIIYCLLLFYSIPTYANNPYNYANYSTKHIISWNSDEGIKRLNRSKYKNDFYKLAHNFQPQINPLYCGIASSVIILNSLRLGSDRIETQDEIAVIKPKTFGGGKIEFPAYSQYSLLNDKTSKIKEKSVINLKKAHNNKYDPGLTLKQLQNILETYQLNVKILYADKIESEHVDNFRSTLKKVLNDNSVYMVANYYGKLFGATTAGHISPIAAYDKKTDSILILDVAGHKNPWYWVNVKEFYYAMHKRDGNKSRGYLIISEK